MNGIIIIDKPEGKTSHDMVYEVRRLTGIKKVGHTGTLDPLATGVLPICVGKATKAADMLTASEKKYRAEMLLGTVTDTGDITGTVTATCEVNVTEEQIRASIVGFVGEIEQIPPMYSAIKQNGVKLYELARRGIETERKPRKVTIHSIDIISIDDARVTMDVHCSKGTYIRTLCEDIGGALGTGACMSALRRTMSGGFTIEQAHTVEALRQMRDMGKIEDALIAIDSVFGYDKVVLNEFLTAKAKNGVAIRRTGLSEGALYRVYAASGEFIAVSRYTDGALKLEKAFWS